MSNKGLTTWSQQDQFALDVLLARKEHFECSTMNRLNEAVASLCVVQGVFQPPLAEQLRARAEQFRDALAPFDSGVSCTTQDET